MQIRLLVVGKPRRDVLDVFVADYLHRIQPIWQISLVTVSEERLSNGRNDADVLAREAERIRDKIPSGWVSVALDRTGKAMDSLVLAETLQGWNNSSIRGVAFVIGSAVGLDPSFAQSCTMRLSLSAMTFPHDVTLILVAEQIYRAATIIKRLPYHR